MQAFFCLNNIVTFKDYFVKPDLSTDGTKRRHRGPIPGANTNRKHQNIVPARYKTDNSKNQKIEMLKQNKVNKFDCDSNDLQYITTTFLKGTAPVQGQEYTLGGKMGIKLYHNGNAWVIQKDLHA